MNAQYWDDKVDWLKTIRTSWFNDDYFEFLVERVWNIKDPVNIIDYGCGFGYVGLLLMPILPSGSTYTGVDISDNLLNEAKNIFSNSGYTTAFIKADLNDYIPNEQYDIAITQAVLRHIPYAQAILKKMIQSTVNDGLVICMETDLEMEKAGQYFSGLDYSELGLTPLMRKMWKTELSIGGRDHRFAIKIPVLMQEFGLHDVKVRISDRVSFINPYEDESEHSKQYDTLTKAWGWNEQILEEDRIDYINSLKGRGLNDQEAEMYFKSESKIREYVMNNKDNAFIIKAPCTLISFGTK